MQAPQPRPGTLPRGPGALAVPFLSLFFLTSGFAALIYQIVWQRALFTAFGVNIESITIIVAVFMFGLGIGSLVGGYLSHRFPRHLPHLFLVCELAIGLFGLVSLPLIRAVSDFTLHGSLFVIGAAVYALLCIPTIFMGATLPILSAYLHRTNRNVGKSVSTLYFFNTLGSAVACFVTAAFLFKHYGLQETVYLAALCNLVVGLGVFLYVRFLPASNPSEPAKPLAQAPEPEVGAAPRSRWQFGLVLVLAAAVGYLALSQEILWLRAVSYATGDMPADFAFVLGAILFGVALGAGFSRWCCHRNPDSALTVVAVLLARSAIVYALALPLFAHLVTLPEETLTLEVSGKTLTWKDLGMVTGFLLAGFTAFLLGAVLPSLCHYAIRGGRVGLPVSWIYFANIVGATAGPLLTGFVLLDRFSLEENVLILSWMGAGLAALVAILAPVNWGLRGLLVGELALFLVALVLSYEGLFGGLLEKLHYRNGFPPGYRYKHLVQNRSGIVAVQAGPADYIFGGAVYDGQFNIDPVVNSNHVTRAYILPSFHPGPREVLVVGLSSGSWLRALTLHTGIQKFTVVEINPAYLEVMAHYPEIALALKDPRVTVIIDDGRRWLNRNPDARFDLMVMNSTVHWRSHATNLLSEEFLHICKDHLKPGGIIYYNTTSSDDVIYTAANVFKHVVMHMNFAAASDSPIDPTPEQRRERLLRYEHKGKPIFLEGMTAREEVPRPRKKGEPRYIQKPLFKGEQAALVLDYLSRTPLVDVAPAYLRRTDLYLITDDNMATEFRRDRE